MTTIIHSFLPRRRAQIAAQRAFQTVLGADILDLKPRESQISISERIQADLRRLVAEGIVYGHADFPRNALDSPQVNKDNDKPLA